VQDSDVTPPLTRQIIAWRIQLADLMKLELIDAYKLVQSRGGTESNHPTRDGGLPVSRFGHGTLTRADMTVRRRYCAFRRP